MPSAGIPIRPSFVRSIHARIDAPAPFTRVQKTVRQEDEMKLPHRRKFLHLAAGAAALPAISPAARAQAYPSRPVRLIVPLAPAGASDITARLIGQWLSERLGQQFVIDNRPGGGGNIGTEAVVRAPADGYTLLLVGGFNAINATLYDKLNFNFIRDIAPVGSVIRFPYGMVVNPSVPAKSVPEFIAYAKANPGKVNMASAGTGAPSHVIGELFKMMTGVDMVHVPYRSGGPALTDLLGGQGEVMFPPTVSSIWCIKTGRLRALPGGTRTRLGVLPDIPTAAGFLPGFQPSFCFGVGAPKATPVEIVDKLNKEVDAALDDPKMKARLAELGGTVLHLGRLRQADRRRNREVGQGGEVHRHQGGLRRGKARTFHNCRSANSSRRAADAVRPRRRSDRMNRRGFIKTLIGSTAADLGARSAPRPRRGT